jgi:AraC family transcriptional regulator
MESVRKALWFMEGRFGGEVSLDELSQAAGISRFHFAHVFARATGQSAMRYRRGRRLSEAARVLANGDPDILSVALDFGYSSHEAFTRAFRDQFGLTPESVRAQRHLDNVNLVEAIKMDDGLITTLATPRIEQRGLLLIAGLGGKYSSDIHQNIPALWQRLQPHLGNVPGQVFPGGGGKGGRTFGVCYNMDDDCNFDYLAGVEVSGFSSDLPAEFARLRIPSQRYAIFTHHEHVSTMHNVAMTIWTKWLPESGYEAVDAPYLEYYGEEFDGRTGMGGFQMWIPIKT